MQESRHFSQFSEKGLYSAHFSAEEAQEINISNRFWLDDYFFI